MTFLATFKSTCFSPYTRTMHEIARHGQKRVIGLLPHEVFFPFTLFFRRKNALAPE